MFKAKLPNINFSFDSVSTKAKEIWYTPKARSQAIACSVLILLSLLPIILSAIVFAVSKPTAAARTAIYLVTFAFALVASGYAIYVFRKRIIAILAKESTGNYVMKERQKHKQKQQQNLPTHYVSNAVDAFSSEQREYNRRHGDQAFISPTLASSSTGHYLMPNHQAPEYLPYEPLQMPDPEAHTNAPNGNTTAANDLYLVPMPQPRTLPLQVRNLIESDDSIGKKATPPEMNMPTPPPPSYSGVAPKMPLPPVASNKGLDGSPDMPPLPRLHVLTPQAPTRPKSTLNLPPLPAGSAPAATASDDSKKAAAQHQDEIMFDSEDDSEDDDDGVKLFSFDKVKVRTDGPMDQQLYGSHSRMTIMSSVESVAAFASQQSLNIKAQAANNDTSTSASTSNINLSQIKQASDAATRAADGNNQQESQQSSFSDLPSQPETMSSGTKSVLEKFPEPPKSKLRLSIFPENSSEADLVEKWLQTSSQPAPPNPATRQLKKTSVPAVPSPLSSSIADLVIPDKFVSAEGSKIVKSPTKPSSQEQVMSIYGERDALANIRDSEVSQYDLPGQISYVNSVVDIGPVPAIPKRPDLNVSRADPDDLEKIDEPLLESSDLSLRRPTLVDFQKKADAKRKLMGGLNQDQSQDSERSIGGNLNDDSRYFSAVSLPQTQNQTGAPTGNFMDIAEDDEDSDDEHEEEAFLDSDSDDEAIGSLPQSAADATALHFTGNNNTTTPAGSTAVAAISATAAATAFAQATNESTEWRPASVSMDSLAAQLAKAITHSDKPHDSLVSTHEAGLRDSLLIKSRTPAASPHIGLQPPSPSRLPANILSRGLRDSQFDEPRAPPRPSDSSIFLDGEDYGADLVMTSIARNTEPETQK
ncbi:hypothetical protein LPJ53_003150 [Coemansia erecta]|uniref:Uncharacterized protein n=1 Tax=Coemansia erecta TaxID=147472 RepID=A0A9W8CR46_9FUNG|nr:hypothetical protein LPJ53_003150 [Coemansia erecta]